MKLDLNVALLKKGRYPLKWFDWVMVTTIVAALAVIGMAHAAIPTTYTVTWQSPTEYEDGSPMTGAATYQLYVGPSGQEVKYHTPVTAPPYVLMPTPGVGTNTCVQITTTVKGVESAKSSEVCATVPFPKPNAPSMISVTVK